MILDSKNTPWAFWFRGCSISYRYLRCSRRAGASASLTTFRQSLHTKAMRKSWVGAQQLLSSQISRKPVFPL